MSSSAERERRIDPIVPLGGGDFLLLGDDRRMYRAGQWSSDAPVRGAFAAGHVRAAIRDGSRLLGLVDTLVAVSLDGKSSAPVPLRHRSGGEFYGTALGSCDDSRVCVVAQDLSRLDVLVLDANLRVLHQDQLMNGEASIPFAAGKLWLAADAKVANIVSYRKRQMTEYANPAREER